MDAKCYKYENGYLAIVSDSNGYGYSVQVFEECDDGSYIETRHYDAISDFTGSGNFRLKTLEDVDEYLKKIESLDKGEILEYEKLVDIFANLANAYYSAMDLMDYNSKEFLAIRYAFRTILSKIEKITNSKRD